MILLYRVFKFLLLVLLFTQCKNDEKDCSIKIASFGTQKNKIVGCFYRNLEEGEWQFFNDENKLTEKGYFENGFRIGKWHYFQNKSDSVIEWKMYEKKSLNLTFNIPVLLEIVEDSAEYIKFSNNDTSKLANIVISIYSFSNLNNDIEHFYKQTNEEITSNGWTYTCKNKKIKTSNRDIYMNEYSIYTGVQKFSLLYTYLLLNNNSIFEISCRFSNNIESSARIIYFSMLTNIFFNNQRLMNPFENIKSMVDLQNE